VEPCPFWSFFAKKILPQGACFRHYFTRLPIYTLRLWFAALLTFKNTTVESRVVFFDKKILRYFVGAFC